jgi:hypothetical protein
MADHKPDTPDNISKGTKTDFKPDESEIEVLSKRAIQAAQVSQAETSEAETSEAEDEDVYDSIDLEPFDDHLFRTPNLEPSLPI